MIAITIMYFSHYTEFAVSSPDVTSKYKEILKANGILDEVSEVSVNYAGLRGEGMSSQTLYVTVTFEKADVKPLNLFVKEQVVNPSLAAMTLELKLFEKESTFLRDYVPEAREFCKMKGLPNIMDFYPKLYYADKSLIVLENLVLDKDYVLLKKEEKQDLCAASLALENLAKHHAISFALIRELGGADKFFQRFQHLDYEVCGKPIFKGMMEPSLMNAIDTSIKLLEKYSYAGSDKAIADIKSLAYQPMNLILNAVNSPPAEAELMALSHGDYWNNNMMFLKEVGTNKLAHQVLIDFQCTRYNSLVLDIGYYLFTSVKSEVRQAHLHDLLKTYLITYNQLTSDLGHPTNLAFEQLLLEFRRKLNYGFSFGMCLGFGPALTIMKDVDLSEGDMDELTRVFEKLLNKWLEQHPDEAAAVAKELVTIMDEYRQLTLEEK